MFQLFNFLFIQARQIGEGTDKKLVVNEAHMLDLLALDDSLFGGGNFIGRIAHEKLSCFGQTNGAGLVTAYHLLPVLHTLRAVAPEEALTISFSFLQDLHNLQAVEVVDIYVGAVVNEASFHSLLMVL